MTFFCHKPGESLVRILVDFRVVVASFFLLLRLLPSSSSDSDRELRLAVGTAGPQPRDAYSE